MHSSKRELWLSFVAILVITLLYLFVVVSLGGIPAASEFFGHSLGVVGFILMLLTETLYSIRKRSRQARWGRMSTWLQFHIFTGLVGPFLVLLHSAWKFNGLAGIVTLMTALVVLSGFIGRYIYTAVPRSVDGLEIETGELERNVRALEAELQAGLASQPRIASVFIRHPAPGRGPGELAFAFERQLASPISRLQWWFARRRLDAPTRVQAVQLEQLLRRRRTLKRQVTSLAQTRRWLAVWHAVHIPLGMALFTSAFIHMGAAIYYATLLR